MGRRASWSLAAGLVLGSASVVAAAGPSLDVPATVATSALRVSPPTESVVDPLARLQAELVTIINLERGRVGLPLMASDDRVAEAAHAHAVDMAAMASLQHAGSDGSDAGLRLDRTGYRWSDWGENIAVGFADPVALFAAWMNSPEHREHLLGAFSDIGVGVSEASGGSLYWSLVVATPTP